MKANLINSDKQFLDDDLEILQFFLDYPKRSRAVDIIIRLELARKKALLKLKIYKKLIKFRLLKTINSSIFSWYCMFKRYLSTSFPWMVSSLFSTRDLTFLVYHFLVLYQAIFLLKMILDWFPIKNWDSSSPFKRFLRKITIGWTKRFEKYFPSFLAWIIVINIAPILLSMTENFYIARDFASFPISYGFDQLMQYLIWSVSLNYKPDPVMDPILWWASQS